MTGDPRAAAVLAVPVVEAPRVHQLAAGVPGQLRMPCLELTQGTPAQAAVLPAGREADRVQQPDSAPAADAIGDGAKFPAITGNREPERRRQLPATAGSLAGSRLSLIDHLAARLTGQLEQVPGQGGVNVRGG